MILLLALLNMNVVLLRSFNNHLKLQENNWIRSFASTLYSASTDDKLSDGKKRGIIRKSTGKEIRQISDPWKALVTKLESSKSSKERFGKLELKSNSSTPNELNCPHFGSCSGCSLNGNFDSAPIIVKAKNYFKSEDIPFRIRQSTSQGWRTHAKLAVQALSRWGGIKIGLYKSGTHEVEPIPDCRVHHPRINEAIDVLKRAALDAGVKGFQKSTNNLPSQGELRYIQLTVERSTNKIQLVLVWNADQYKEAEQSLPRLVKRLRAYPDVWHSIYANFQTSETNAIFNYAPKSWKLLWGPPSTRERIGRATFYYTPQIFRQVSATCVLLPPAVGRIRSPEP